MSSILCNAWVSRGDSVALLTFERGNRDFFPLNSLVERWPLGIASQSTGFISGFVNNVSRIAALRRALRTLAPEVVITFMDRPAVLISWARLGSRIRQIACERTVPEMAPVERGVWSLLRRWAYRRADAVVVQTRAAQKWFHSQGRRDDVYVVPNPVIVDSPGEPTDSALDLPPGRNIVALGRLHRVKGFDLLLRAFQQVHLRLPDVTLSIFGEGPERDSLQQLAVNLGIREKVKLPGQFRNPWPVLRRADSFVLSSYYEGFPNALCEAMASGIAVVSFDCPYGPSEIIEHGQNGILVAAGDISALADGMHMILTDERRRLAIASRSRALADRLHPRRILALWDEVFVEACRPRR